MRLDDDDEDRCINGSNGVTTLLRQLEDGEDGHTAVLHESNQIYLSED